MGLAGLGLLRLPDAYTRMNATGKAGGLGVVCVYAIARTTYRARAPLAPSTAYDELAEQPADHAEGTAGSPHVPPGEP